jgi:hypothetical protein
MEILNELLAKQVEFQKSLDGINKKLEEQAQKKTVVQVDHQAITSQIRVGLPSPEQFQKASDQISDAISRIPKKVAVESPDQMLGFINIKSLLIHYAVFFSLVVIVSSVIIYSKNQDIENLQYSRARLQEDQRNYNNFVDWIQKKHPKVWEAWKKE